MFTVRRATEADLDRIVSIYNETSRDQETMESFRAREGRRPAELPYIRLVAVTPDDTVAGFGAAGTGPDRDPGHFFVSVRVSPPYEGLGVGRALCPEVERWAWQQGAVCLEAGVRDTLPASLAWAQRRGYTNDGHVFLSRLDLTRWDPAPFQPAVDTVVTSGLRITTLAAENLGEEGLRRYHSMCQTLERDIPGRGPRTPPYEQWRRMADEDPAWNPAGVILVVDGDRWAALSVVEKMTDGSWYTHLTVTHPDYRGRGVGLAAKVASLQHALEQGATVATTHNHSVNGPMLAINRKLGYQPEEGLYQLTKHQ